MKDFSKLPSNYTNKEQSERLMEVLNIPASTADLVYVRTDMGGHLLLFPDDMIDGDYVEYPVWSVGRIIDIILTCVEIDHISVYKGENHIDDLLHFIEYSQVGHTFDFSKLYTNDKNE